MTERKSLWSEATSVLEFGEGTKIRIGNVSVRLKGTYHREDSFAIQQMQRDIAGAKKAISDAHQILTDAYEEKYPYDASKTLPERIKNAAARLAHERSEKQKLIVMVSDRDAEISRLKGLVAGLKKNIVRQAGMQMTQMVELVHDHA